MDATDRSPRPEPELVDFRTSGPGDGAQAPDAPVAASPCRNVDPSAEEGSHAAEQDPAHEKEDAPTRTALVIGTIVIWTAIIILIFFFLKFTAPTCTSSSVLNSVTEIVETKILHVKRFSVTLIGVKALSHNFFLGDLECSGDVDIDGKPTSHKIQYDWETYHNRLSRVHAKLTS